MISDERKVEIETWDINFLIEKGTQLQEQANSTYEEVKLIKFLLLKHMRETNATMLAHPMVECKAKKENTSWNYNLLKPVLEHLDKSGILSLVLKGLSLIPHVLLNRVFGRFVSNSSALTHLIFNPLKMYF